LLNIPSDTEFELNIHQNISIVFDELKRRGRRLESVILNKKDTEIQVVKISSLFTENHFRFIVYIVLKGMLYLGYSSGLLMNMINYVKNGDPLHLKHHFVDQYESGFDSFDDPSLKLFYYSFDWSITADSIDISASILAHKNVNGVRIKISCVAGNDSSIIIPFGKIIAKYGETPDDGVLELYKGSDKVF
jgi:hypothetical protein